MLRGYIATAIFFVVTALCGLPATVLALLGWKNATMFFARIWAALMLRVVGARVTWEGLERRHTDRPVIYLANHQSNVDIWAMIRVMPLSTRFVAKQSLFRIPFLGSAMRAAGFIAIDRTDRHRAIASLRAAAAQISAGSSVVLYPEGTRSQDGQLQPLKKGPFHLAVQSQVPIVPMVVQGTRAIMRPGSLEVRPGPAQVRFLPWIEPEEYGKDADKLRARVTEVLSEALGQPRPATGGKQRPKGRRAAQQPGPATS